MDVFVFPSYYEGLPGALQEAMAAALPIVATSANGNDELITHGETGLLAPIGDPDKIRKAVNKLLANPTLATSLGQAAAQEATDRFSLESMVHAFEELYMMEEILQTNQT
jgi:glycosyltransferase involved in cell wall biosynthesis